MKRDSAYFPSRGLSCLQVYQLMSLHVEWHDDKGFSLYPFTWSDMMTKYPADIPHVEWHDDKGFSLYPFTWSGMMTKYPADIPPRGVACCQVYQLMSLHVVWHNDKGSSSYPLSGVAC